MSTPHSQTAAAQALAAKNAHNRLRKLKDSLARYLVLAGGLSVIGALVLIFFYLFYVVLPLFAPADMEKTASYPIPGGLENSMYLSIEEQAEIGLSATRDGEMRFFRVSDGQALNSERLPLPLDASLVAMSEVNRNNGTLAFAHGDNDIVLVRHRYRIKFDGDERSIEASLEYPYGETSLALRDRPEPVAQPLTLDTVTSVAAAAADVVTAESVPLPGIRQFVVRDNDGTVRVIAQTEDEQLWWRDYSQSSGLFALAGDGEINAGALRQITTRLDIRHMILTPDGKRLYLADSKGRIEAWGLQGTEAELIETVSLLPQGVTLQNLLMLTGGSSLVAAGDDGVMRQWFPVRGDDNVMRLTEIRQFPLESGKLQVMETEHRRRGFLTGDAQGNLSIYYTTSDRRIISEDILDTGIDRLAVAPRSDTLLIGDESGQVHVYELHNEHPEVSWSALWGKVWYEGYEEADYVWQSSAASSDFEPKFSLTPLAFGTLKAAFYAMVIAVPLAIMGAIFTANFMAPRMRTLVKPTIEVMEALPTVILGFLAGLWLAPLAEANLPAALMLVPALIFGLIFAAWAWSRMPGSIRYLIPEGWEAALLIPAVILIVTAVFAISSPIENIFFGGNMPQWFDQTLGIGYDQRNALVVGFAMGFAVIPTIFSISEDAIFSVPKHLSQGSLALGATPWQTLMRVVLPTASPGIFSAVMIGLGRAVGETMIVLMATGNTAVMDFSIFEGMRTLSANIAVEMPESEVASTHYRILFLAGLVLFIFTFFFNTMAETVRQRLRKKYSSI